MGGTGLNTHTHTHKLTTLPTHTGQAQDGGRRLQGDLLTIASL